MTAHHFVDALVDALGLALEATGVILLALGVAMALLRSLRGADPTAARWQRLRHDLGRALLIGLEVLVAADIVRSVAVGLSMASVAELAAIVAIRTFLGWSLALELDGRWPWQRPPHPHS
jgi:uncharacterized membrane protein